MKCSGEHKNTVAVNARLQFQWEGHCCKLTRAVASLTVPGGQEFHFPHFFLKFWSSFLIFPQILLLFFLILALQVGESPTREGPGYATEIDLQNFVCTKFDLLVTNNEKFPQIFPYKDLSSQPWYSWNNCCNRTNNLTNWIFIHSAYTTHLLQPVWINNTQNTQK